MRGQFQLDALGEALSLLAAAAGRHARRGRLAGGGDRRRRHREALAGPGRRHLGTRRPALDALPARLRGRAASDRDGGRAGRRRTGTGRRRAGRHWPTRSPRASATACTLPGGCSGRRAISGWTPHCCCRSSGARCRCPTRVPSRPSRRCGPSSASTGTCTGSGMTTGRCTWRRERSCCAGAGWRSRRTRAASRWRRRTGSSGTAAPAGPPRCTPRSTTCTSGSCGATCRRHSCTPGCSSAR